MLALNGIEGLRKGFLGGGKIPLDLGDICADLYDHRSDDTHWLAHVLDTLAFETLTNDAIQSFAVGGEFSFTRREKTIEGGPSRNGKGETQRTFEVAAVDRGQIREAGIVTSEQLYQPIEFRLKSRTILLE
jgi:hypothetical protein